MFDKIKIELGDRYMIRLSEDACIFIDQCDATYHWTVYCGRDYFDIHQTRQIDNKRTASIRLYYDDLGTAILDVIEKYREPLIQACIQVDDPTYKNWMVLPVKMKDFDESSLEEGRKGRRKITERTMQHFVESKFTTVMFPDIMHYDFDWAWVIQPPTGELLIRLEGEDKYLFQSDRELFDRIFQDLWDRVKPLLQKKGAFTKPGCQQEDCV